MYTVSVIVATYNRCELLRNALRSLLAQECDGRFRGEIIIVDNNSRDATRQSAETGFLDADALSRAAFPLGFKYLFEPQQGKVHALNKGIKEAKGEILMFTDDDVTVDKRWILSTVKCFEDHHCDGVGGRVLPVYSQQTPDWIKNEPKKMGGIVVIYDHGENTRKYERTMEEFIGANFAFKETVFDECGSFCTDIGKGVVPVGEDRELFSRALRHNKILYYCGQAVVWHPVDPKRASLRHIAQWNIAQGWSAAYREHEDRSKKFICYFHVPRYLLAGIIGDFLLIFPSIFRRRALFLSLKRFFRKMGMIRAYRAMAKSRALKEQGCG